MVAISRVKNTAMPSWTCSVQGMYSRWLLPMESRNPPVYRPRIPPQNKMEPLSDAHSDTMVKYSGVDLEPTSAM